MDGGSAVLHRLPPLPKRREGGIWFMTGLPSQILLVQKERATAGRREQRESSQNSCQFANAISLVCLMGISSFDRAACGAATPARLGGQWMLENIYREISQQSRGKIGQGLALPCEIK